MPTYVIASNVLNEMGGVFRLAGQGPVVEYDRGEASFNGVGESASDAVEGEPRCYITEKLERNVRKGEVGGGG